KLLKILIIALISLTVMACSISVNVPTVETGFSRTLEISEPAFSDVDDNKIIIEMGAGRLYISTGASNLINGTVEYNVEDWKPEISRSSNTVSVSQKNSSNTRIPSGNIQNDWNLQLGDDLIDLTINAGAYEGKIDLSGLSITNLQIADGASKSTIHFDTLNPVEMDEISYKTGASEIELFGLGNANTKSIYFASGVGSYTLDFSGDIQDDINVRIQSGMSDMTIIIPDNARAKVKLTNGLSNIDATGTWTISGSTYESGTSGPLITINLDMAIGNLQLIQQ
ncbi:MAG: toast rack family protein, partial [Anaerolineaceae bacterium]|nr:toast rack family protein [Anaerolineaceae bacterium]